MQDDVRPQSPQNPPGRPDNASGVQSWQPERRDAVPQSMARPITPPSQPAATTQIPVPPTQDQPIDPAPTTATPVPQPQPAAPVPVPEPIPPSDPASAPTDVLNPDTTAADMPTVAEDPEVSNSPAPQNKSTSSRLKSFTVSLLLFALFSALFLLPILPGKVWLGAPLSSSYENVGGSLRECKGTQSGTSTTVNHQHKKGFPLAYRATTYTDTVATCNGKTTILGRDETSDFNLLALIIDVLCALLLTIICVRLLHRQRNR